MCSRFWSTVGEGRWGEKRILIGILKKISSAGKKSPSVEHKESLFPFSLAITAEGTFLSSFLALPR